MKGRRTAGKELWKKLGLLLGGGALCLALAACGSGSNSEDAVYEAVASEAAPEAVAEGEYYDYDGYAEAEPPVPAEAYEDTGGYAQRKEAADAWWEEETAPNVGGEAYDESGESPFLSVTDRPLSTFSSDVDTASYSNLRRYIQQGNRPQGVRIEELINYFDYDYPAPRPGSDAPFNIVAEIAECPWNPDHDLAMIAVQGAEMDTAEVPSNIVFLIDVSGSMNEPTKLPLLKESFKMMVGTLDGDDVVSIVTYAGSAAVVTDSVRGSDKAALISAIDGLQAGGSTAGGQGLRTAYDLAEKNLIRDGNNRILLASDGDFNVGESNTDQMMALIEEERDKGVFISALGFGMGNLKDDMMETIADNGNGNYAYIDTLQEAQKVLVDEFDSTMFVIAKDVKFQVEFNPGLVQEYRLIGYNNRRMRDQDFNDDSKDAGDIGSGHSVTVFYELIPTGGGGGGVDGLKYQSGAPEVSPAAASGVYADEYMTVKVRYKQPNGSTGTTIELPVDKRAYKASPSETFRFASAVAEFGLIATDSAYREGGDLQRAHDRAAGALGEDAYGLRAEFADLVVDYARMWG